MILCIERVEGLCELRPCQLRNFVYPSVGLGVRNQDGRECNAFITYATVCRPSATRGTTPNFCTSDAIT